MSKVANANTIPSFAVDGNNGTDWNSDFSAVSAYYDLEPWWMVDLLGFFPIHDVIITSMGGPYCKQHYFIIVFEYLSRRRFVISGASDVTICASRCQNSDCLAFNYNQNSQQCQLISAPTFEDSRTMTSSWNYYGVDLC
ncbi:uncharacterized protein LOC121373050 [Gigantopelta aegis]|uniref:uncharacterized protein LOC121373050 n=1 Tax=Gigantopelta aegis TaxID=1735272 RepID=UPI001B88923C|nr:uncharacterized protein LOC121373050 [Gigantopelta aegis]